MSLSSEEEIIRIKQENFIKNGIYHIYNRSVAGELLYRAVEDYRDFLKRFKILTEKYSLSVFSYCLMPNHFHFLIKQNSDKPVNLLFNSLLSGYVQRYNNKYQRAGRLMSNKLQHKAIDSDNYLIYVIRYIHLNPMNAGLVDDLSHWEFSNYLEWIGLRKEKLVDPSVRESYYSSPDAYKLSYSDDRDDFNYSSIKEFLIDFDE